MKLPIYSTPSGGLNILTVEMPPIIHHQCDLEPNSKCDIKCQSCIDKMKIRDEAINHAKRTSIPFEDQKKMKLTLINEGKDITPGSFTFLEFDGEVKIVETELKPKKDGSLCGHFPSVKKVARLVPAVPKEEKKDKREEDIQLLCIVIKEMSIQSTGDYKGGGQCPFCFKDCSWQANSVSDIEHEPTCAVLIAKDLSTNHGK
jgi:hypothetical protein